MHSFIELTSTNPDKESSRAMHTNPKIELSKVSINSGTCADYKAEARTIDEFTSLK